MCTVTLIRPEQPSPSPQGLLLRMAANRDVSRERSPALIPQLRIYKDVKCLMPVDPISDGTWLAVNEAGLMVTLLNRTLPKHEQPPTHKQMNSRGLIIPHVIHHQTARAAADEALKLSATMYPTFRLVLLDDQDLIELRSDGYQIHELKHGMKQLPFMITSSGLGDHLVESPRRALFEEIFPESKDLLKTQVDFHHHVWPDQSPLSVNMAREDARTVSYTLVDRYADRIEMQYHGEAPGQPGVDASMTLPLSRIVNA